MHDLAPLTALGGTTARRDTIAGLTIAEVPDLAFASVSARLTHEGDCRDALARYLRSDLPGPGKARLLSPVSAFWLGPDQWMLSAPFHSHELLAEDVKATLQDAGSVTEQSDAWAAFDVDGDNAVDLTERLCAAPARRMQTGDAHRTTLHHLSCFVIALAAQRQFRFIGPRSAAGSLHHALIAAAHSVA